MNFFGNFGRDRRGSVALAFGLSILMLGLFVGLAIDTARVYSVSRKVQFALDSAALEGAKLMNETLASQSQLQQRAHSAFGANTRTLDSRDAALSAFQTIADTASSLVNVSVNVRVPAAFAKLAGIENFDFVKVSSSSYSMAQLEIVLALDVTGSMNDTPAGDTRAKIDSLKIAATSLVNRLFDDAATDQNVRISVVPWSSGVNAGAYSAAATGHVGANACVVERSGSGATSASLPDPTTYAQPMPAAALAIGYVCPSRPVSPLQGRLQRNNIISQIGSLTAAGGTAGHIGTAWAWYMISPAWATLHPVGSQPAAPSPNVIKSVIIMTDGIYNTSFAGGGMPTPGNQYDSASYSMFQTLCQGMRDQHIVVHTVALDLTDTRALDELATCASSGTALTAANSSQLTDVFEQMVAQLNALRLTR
jgi:Flp pilus assembly protein TadG